MTPTDYIQALTAILVLSRFIMTLIPNVPDSLEDTIALFIKLLNGK